MSSRSTAPQGRPTLLLHFLIFSNRFAEFPQPGDVKKQMLPIYVDPEETKTTTFSQQNDSNSKRQDNLDHWMPVRHLAFLIH
jgi:hypothetical protein